jgi:serine/threonine protein kinase
MSFEKIIEMFRRDDNITTQILQILDAVEHMHNLGFVHRNLSPNVIFQSHDPDRAFFIGDHYYTTQISNSNMNTGLPGNKYMIKSTKWRAGSKKQDLNALGGIIMAWAVGLDEYKKTMKKQQDRLRYAWSFQQDTSYHPNLREIVGGTLLKPEAPLKLAQIRILFEAYLEDTSPETRLPKNWSG